MKLKAGSQTTSIKLKNFQPDSSGKKERRHILPIPGMKEKVSLQSMNEQLYCNKFGQLNETDKIFEKQPQLTQEMESPNSPISTKEIEFMGKTLPNKENSKFIRLHQ